MWQVWGSPSFYADQEQRSGIFKEKWDPNTQPEAKNAAFLQTDNKKTSSIFV
jgi:hypothetical protein